MELKSNFTLLHDLVMIFPIKQPQKTSSGLVLPDTMDATSPVEGLVLEVGPGKINPKTGDVVPVPLQKGDRVFFVKHEGKVIKHSGDTFLVVPVTDILCKVVDHAPA